MVRALGVIPARGGSKRLPRKNVLPLASHPLVAWTIRAAAGAELLTDWLVSSDDDEIINIAEKYGAPVPFRRPAELSGDKVRNNETVRHALDFMEEETGQHYDIVVLMQPTCPIRDPRHIDEAILQLSQAPYDSVASVKGPYKKPHPIVKKIQDGVLEPWCKYAASYDASEFYLYNAALYAVKRDYFLREKRLISERQIPIVMDKFHSVDVDDEADLIMAEAYISHLGYKMSEV